jgi:CubicO group peptidase (beta-lactamase class C family)
MRMGQRSDPIIHSRRTVIAGAATALVGGCATGSQPGLPGRVNSRFSSQIDAKIDEKLHNLEPWGIHGIAVRYQGDLIYERYFTESRLFSGSSVAYGPEVLHDMQSVSKSITGLLYGIALSEGLVAGLDISLRDALPHIPDLPEQIRPIKMRHVLNMTMGLEWREQNTPYIVPFNDAAVLHIAASQIGYVLGKMRIDEPGSNFNYNGGATALLGHIIAHGVGMSLTAYARSRLFAPLGIRAFEWRKAADGVEAAASGLRLTPRDMTLIGEMILKGGKAGGRTIVPQNWLAQSFVVSAPKNSIGDYGFQWWLKKPAWARKTTVSAYGIGGQRLFIVPGSGLSVAVTAGNMHGSEEFRKTDWICDKLVPRALGLLNEE